MGVDVGEPCWTSVGKIRQGSFLQLRLGRTFRIEPVLAQFVETLRNLAIASGNAVDSFMKSFGRLMPKAINFEKTLFGSNPCPAHAAPTSHEPVAADVVTNRRTRFRMPMRADGMPDRS